MQNLTTVTEFIADFPLIPTDYNKASNDTKRFIALVCTTGYDAE